MKKMFTTLLILIWGSIFSIVGTAAYDILQTGTLPKTTCGGIILATVLLLMAADVLGTLRKHS